VVVTHTREDLNLKDLNLNLKLLEDNIKLLELRVKKLEEEDGYRKEREEEEKKKGSTLEKQFTILLAEWKRLLPTNQQPTSKPVLDRYLAKFKARMRDAEFRLEWQPTLERASTHIGIRKSKNITLEYFLRNDINWRKIQNGVLDFWDKQYTDEEIQPTVSAYDVWEAQQNG